MKNSVLDLLETSFHLGAKIKVELNQPKATIGLLLDKLWIEADDDKILLEVSEALEILEDIQSELRSGFLTIDKVLLGLSNDPSRGYITSFNKNQARSQKLYFNGDR